MYAFYKKVRGLGGYKAVTTRKLWKRIYDELGGSQSNTSAATCTRKHYERLLLPYEEKLASENVAQKGPRRRIGLSVEKRGVAEKTLVTKKTPAQVGGGEHELGNGNCFLFRKQILYLLSVEARTSWL